MIITDIAPFAGTVGGGWPALGGVEERIKGDARVADVGCGYGISTLIMAKAYPSSTFIAPSIEYARSKAKEEWFTQDRVKFELASSN